MSKPNIDFEEMLDAKAAELARVDNKSTKMVRDMRRYTVYFALALLFVFAISVYGINTAKSNGGIGLSWFAAFISGLLFLGSLSSLIGIVLELMGRPKDR